MLFFAYTSTVLTTPDYPSPFIPMIAPSMHARQRKAINPIINAAPPVRRHAIFPPLLSSLEPVPQSRNNPLRIPREKTTHANIRQTQPKLHYALEPKPTSGMRRTAKFEALDVVLCSESGGVDGRVVYPHLLGEEGRVVDALGAGADFLAAHEHVVGVREGGVGGRGHGVCGADGEGKLVECVEV